MDVDPVSVVESFDEPKIIDAIKTTVAKGNPLIRTPTRAAFPKPVVLAYANVKSWATFEKNALCWSISKKEDIWELCSSRKNPDGGWEDDPEQTETFTGSMAVDEISKIVASRVKREA